MAAVPLAFIMFIRTSWISSGLFAAILFCFFLPFLDVKCNESLIAEVSGFELVTGQDIDNASILPEPVLKDDENIEPMKLDRNYLATAALILALAGFILSAMMKMGREMFLTFIGMAGALCLFVMKIQILTKLARDSEGTAKYIINLEFAFGYWLTLILFLTAAFLNLYAFMDERRRELRSSHHNSA